MTERVKDWLPIDVASRAPVRDAVNGVVRGWSQDWFADHGLQASRFRASADGMRLRSEAEGWRTYAGALAIAASPPAVSKLASWALDAPLASLELTGPDGAVVDGLEHAMLDDLSARIEILLGLPARDRADSAPAGRLFNNAQSVEIAVTDESGALVLSLALPFETMLALCKASLPPRIKGPATLDGLLSALASTPVGIEATFGEAEVGMVELRKLAVGDVLVLDRPLEAGVRFDLPGSDDPFAVAHLGEAEGRLTLTLQSHQD